MQVRSESKRVRCLERVRGGMYRERCKVPTDTVTLTATDERDKNVLMIISSVAKIPIKTKTGADNVVEEYFIEFFVKNDALTMVF